MLTKEEMDRIADETMLSQAARIESFSKEWRADHTGPRHYCVLDENDDRTIYLLGWRPGEELSDHVEDSTPIHGHGDSQVSVTCLQGEVDNESYDVIRPTEFGQLFTCTKNISVLKKGSRTFLPVGMVHDMRCDEYEGRTFSLTLHIYSPKLTSMEYYEQVDNGLRFARTWRTT